jgi:glycosyltransferase involved in cell wall biosynthesis
VIADGPTAFAAGVVRLIRDTGARQQIEAAARRLVVERYDWSAVAQDFEAALERCAQLGSSPFAAGQRVQPVTVAGSI